MSVGSIWYNRVRRDKRVHTRSDRRAVIGSTGAPRILSGSGIKKVRNRKKNKTFLGITKKR